MCRLSSSLCIYWVVCEYLCAYSMYVWMCVSLILAPGRQAGGCRGNPQLATQRITQLQCLTPARCPTQTHPPPQWNPVYALNWPLSHSSRDTTVEFLALHSHFCTALTHVLPMWLSVCMWVCMRWQQRMFGKCHFLPQSDSTGGGSSPFPDSSPIALLDPCARFLSNVLVISPVDQKNDKQIALDRGKLFPPKNGHTQQEFFGGP